MKIKFVVRQNNGAEQSYSTVQKAFALGHACQQPADVRSTSIRYPACFVEDDQARRYGPVLRP